MGLFAEDRGLDSIPAAIFTNGKTGLAVHHLHGREIQHQIGTLGSMKTASDMGIHGASLLLEHMTNMIDAGVDKAFAWPLMHNTQNAFIFRDERSRLFQCMA